MHRTPNASILCKLDEDSLRRADIKALVQLNLLRRKSAFGRHTAVLVALPRPNQAHRIVRVVDSQPLQARMASPERIDLALRRARPPREVQVNVHRRPCSCAASEPRVEVNEHGAHEDPTLKYRVARDV